MFISLEIMVVLVVQQFLVTILNVMVLVTIIFLRRLYMPLLELFGVVAEQVLMFQI